tara:strand:+ start:309 stop:2507 length:2199 start_codon:yes stop_codon:yes gene_type:complete
MSRYRKTMAEAYGAVVENSAIQMQIAALKKAYEPMRNKRISLDNANKLSQIFDKFDSNKEMLKQLYKADIPFVSSVATSRLISKHNMKAQQLMQIRKEDVEKLTDEIKQVREAREKDLEDFEEDLVGDEINEGRMKDIYTMQQAGKSAEEIAKKMGLDVKTVKSILGEQENLDEAPDPTQYGPDKVAKAMAIAVKSSGKYSQAVRDIEKIGRGLSKVSTIARALKTANEETLHEFKKMSVTIRDMDSRKKAITDLQKQNLGVAVHGGVIKVDGKGKDLNNIAKDLMNFYNANVRAESYTIDEEADQHFYNPVTEACWVGYKQVGMKKKGDKMVPNCVPEEVVKEELEDLVEGTGKITGFRNDKEKSNMVSLAKQHSLKVKDIPGGIELSGNMRKILDMQLAAGSHLKTEDNDYLQSKLTGQQIKNIKTTWANKKASDVTPAVKQMIKKMDIPTQLAIKNAGINHLSKLVEEDDKKKEDSEGLKNKIDQKDNEIAALKQKAETDKAKNIQKTTQRMVNPETGEPLLQVGIAYKHMKDKEEREKKKEQDEMKEDNYTNFKKYLKLKEGLDSKDKPTVKKIITKLKGASQAHAGQAKELEKAMKSEMKKDDAYAIGMAQAKKVMNDEPPLEKKTIKKGHEIADKILKKENNSQHPAKEIYESIKAVRNKAEKSGMPYGILKKVYDRGMAAWRGGHRPGATQVQWALARVNSFVTKSSGTWGGADKDLAKQVRGSK